MPRRISGPKQAGGPQNGVIVMAHAEFLARNTAYPPQRNMTPNQDAAK
jgi:hypothetical protein